jgi:hypothetical protein
MSASITPTRRRPDGPPAGVLAVVTLVLSIASIVIPLAVSGTGYPTPASSPEAHAAYVGAHPIAGILTGFLVFGAATPLGIYAATVYARQLRLGIRVPGPGISFFGGIAASVVLAVSGLLTWALATAATGVDPAVVRLFDDVAFALGGAGFAGGLGLLIAGIAVPALVLHLTPRWLAWAGLVLAAIGELSILSLLWSGFDVMIPITRFLGLLWLAAVGFLLPRDRRDVPRTDR